MVIGKGRADLRILGSTELAYRHNEMDNITSARNASWAGFQRLFQRAVRSACARSAGLKIIRIDHRTGGRLEQAVRACHAACREVAPAR